MLYVKTEITNKQHEKAKKKRTQLCVLWSDFLYSCYYLHQPNAVTTLIQCGMGSVWVFCVSLQVLWKAAAEFNGLWRGNNRPVEGESDGPVGAWDCHALPATAEQALPIHCCAHWGGDSWRLALARQSPPTQEPASSTQQGHGQSLQQETQHGQQLLTQTRFLGPNLEVVHIFAKWKERKKTNKTY